MQSHIVVGQILIITVFVFLTLEIYTNIKKICGVYYVHNYVILLSKLYAPKCRMHDSLRLCLPLQYVKHEPTCMPAV